jgi:Tol biopolymer transport system component
LTLTTKTAKPYAFEQFAAVRQYMPGALSFSPDGTEIAYVVNTSGQFNLWRQSTAGGFPHQLTLFTEHTVRAAAWSPDGHQIAFSADQHGDEFTQLYLIPARGGHPEQITEAPQTQHVLEGKAWSPSGRYLASYANDRDDHTNMDILVRDMRTGAVRRVLAGMAFYLFAGWSPDGKQMLVLEHRSNANQDLYLVNPRSGASRLLTKHDGEEKYLPGPWVADSAGFCFLSDTGREYTGLAFYNLRDDRWQWVETPDWDVEEVVGSADGRYLAWVVNENGYTRLHVRNLKTGKQLKLPELPDGAVVGLAFSPNGEKLAVLWSTPTHCAEVFVLSLRQRTLTQLTQSIESDQIVEKLRARGVGVRYDVYANEGHGFTKRENELKMWRDTAEFFEAAFRTGA